ncbi:MAG: hypothetical protein HQL31_03085 [Planctomycetes bacterium]|nr:hypothetical protein [Planctomycetota bacterium]
MRPLRLLVHGIMILALPSMVFGAGKAVFDSDFVLKAFKGKNLIMAYNLAQEEDFQVKGLPLLSQDMRALMDAKVLRAHEGLMREIAALEKELSTLPASDAAIAVAQWRGNILEQMAGAVRVKNSLKPRWGLSLYTGTQYDSNINSVPESNPGPAKHGGKSDWQQSVILTGTWKPQAGREERLGWAYTQPSSAVRYFQSQVKSNDVQILMTEPTLTLYSQGSLKESSLAYRLQHLSLESGRPSDSDIHANFLSHRIRQSFVFRPHMFKAGTLKSTSPEFYAETSVRRYFDDASSVRNASALGLGWTQRFKYAFGKSGERPFSIGLHFRDYRTQADPNSVYSYYKLQLDHSHSNKFSFWRNPVLFSESASYRLKNWLHYLGGEQDEDTLSLSLSLSTQLTARVMGTLSLAHNTKDNDTEGALSSSTSAKQTQATLGFTWRTP